MIIGLYLVHLINYIDQVTKYIVLLVKACDVFIIHHTKFLKLSNDFCIKNVNYVNLILSINIIQFK